jgi:phenylpropionate dioxygenase-like ring-hydroxylating dioxygenase large terminal subunit
MAFLNNTWYVALWAQDLAPNQLVARKFLNQPIVLFRDADGKPAAIADSCAHRFAPLSMGKIVKGSNVRCPYHALEFDSAGKCVHNPHGNGRIASTLKVRSYPVEEKHSLLWIWMGDKDAADPALIPDFGLLDPDSGYLVSKRDGITMQASYELIVDNLMDLSHTAVVHDGILGNENTIKANLTIEQDGSAVSVGRSIPNTPALGLYDLIYKRDGRLVDLWMDMKWYPPACMINYTGVTEPNAPREQGTGFWGMHFLTPQTENTTYYLFVAVRFNPVSWGQPLDAEIQQQVSHLRRVAFEDQDQVIIKAQQDVISGQPERVRPVLLEIDLGPVRYKRVLDKLIAAEQAAAAAATAAE